jgi:surfactin synthase thioesterase subunit
MFLKSSLQPVSNMRTKQQHETEDDMLNDIKTVLTTSRATLVEDASGVAVLFTVLLIGLHLSGAA